MGIFMGVAKTISDIFGVFFVLLIQYTDLFFVGGCGGRCWVQAYEAQKRE